MNQESLIRDVSDTAFWVAHYRAKESERSDALFRDDFAKRLTGTRGKNIAEAMPDVGRYTEWSVVSRTVIIDRFIEQMVKEGVDAVINLGAGLDARPYRMNLPPNLEWVEADHPNIITYKSEILKTAVPSCQLKRVAVDLADDQKRKAFLTTVVPQAKKVLILTEGVIPYLSPEQVADLATDLGAQTRFKFWITEYFHPRVYRYLKRAVRDMKMQNSPFKFYPDDWYGFFSKLGWVEKETRFGGEIAAEFKRKVPMPKFAEFLMYLLPKKIKEESYKMAGFVVLKRG